MLRSKRTKQAINSFSLKWHFNILIIFSTSTLLLKIFMDKEFKTRQFQRIMQDIIPSQTSFEFRYTPQSLHLGIYVIWRSWTYLLKYILMMFSHDARKQQQNVTNDEKVHLTGLWNRIQVIEQVLIFTLQNLFKIIAKQHGTKKIINSSSFQTSKIKRQSSIQNQRDGKISEKICTKLDSLY